jgi:PAS domain S-box-containing protein
VALFCLSTLLGWGIIYYAWKRWLAVHQALHQSEARLTSLINSQVVGVIFVDGSGTIQEANAAFLQIVGYTPEDLSSGLHWRDLTAPEFKAADEAALQVSLQTGAFGPLEKEYIRKDGSRVPVLVSGAVYDQENRRGITLVLDLGELKKAQAEITRLARIVETTDDAVMSVSAEGKVLSWNQAAQRLYGYSRDDVEVNVRVLVPEERQQEYEQIARDVLAGHSLDRLETIRMKKSGERVPVSVTISPLRDQAGKVNGWSAIARDLTEAKKTQKLEEQFRQAQKLEALGRLTGGVAHDFNNLLMVISSYTEMLREQLAPADPLRRKTEEVLRAADRGASLTRQMLAFSRKQVLSPKIIDLNRVLADTTSMLKRMIGEDVTLTFFPGQSLWPIKADPSQITQVLLNLSVNARDAMPTGGKLTIETQNLTVTEQEASRKVDFAAGEYAMLAVTDTGVGMSPEIQERIFEPFFTTKELGTGTGLGLSTVYGIVKQSGGHILVYSEPGKGSCFKLYFPRVHEAVTDTAVTRTSVSHGKGQTILVVEDEDAVRECVVDYLGSHGYKVLQVSSGQQALDLAARHQGPIDLLLTDVVMPEMRGPELAAELNKRGGAITTLYMSGYTDQAVVNNGILPSQAAFLQKPFSLTTLAQKLQELLG